MKQVCFLLVMVFITGTVFGKPFCLKDGTKVEGRIVQKSDTTVLIEDERGNLKSIPVSDIKEDIKSIPASGSRVMKTKDKSYPYNFDGIGRYMKDLSSVNNGLYNTLLPDYKKMEGRAAAGTGLIIGGVIAGAGLAALGFVAQLDNTSTEVVVSKSAYTPEITKSVTTKSYNYYLGIAGGGVALLGIIIGAAIQPNEKDFQQFIDKNNNAEKENPVTIDFAFNPFDRSFCGVLRASF